MNRNEAIQGLRGIAALLVVVAHGILTLIDKVNFSSEVAYLSYGLGELGVEMFFVISGFIMTVTMYEDFGTPHASKLFILKRLIRVVPLYWITTLVYVTKLYATGESPRLSDILLSLLFIPYNHGQPLLAPIYGLGWTLNYEMFFYALFACILGLRRRGGLTVLVIFLSVLVLIRFLGLLDTCAGDLCGQMEFYTRPILLCFVGGVLLGITRKWLQEMNLLPAVGAQTAIGLSLAATLAYGALVSAGYLPEQSSSAVIAQAMVCCLAAATCGLVRYNAVEGRFRVLLLLLGDASYSIYLTHSFLLGPAGRICGALFHDITWLGAVLFVALAVIGCSIVAVLSYRFIEKPVMRSLKRTPLLATA